jgi:uncharacterized protein (DUF1778 family)
MILFNIMEKKTGPPSKSKTALLVYCTHEEAEMIRRLAKQERRTISGFVMTAVANRLAVHSRLLAAEKKALRPPRLK